MSIPDDPETLAALDKVAKAVEQERKDAEGRAGVTTPEETPQPVEDKGILVQFPRKKNRATTPASAQTPPAEGPQPQPAQMLVKNWRAGLTATSTSHEKQTARDVRRREAYRLWLKNWPLREIGRALSVSHKTAWYDIEVVRLELKKKTEQPLERRRDHLVNQHAENQKELWAIADDPKQSAQARIMARSELTRSLAEVAKLDGSYSPMKVASTTPDGNQWAPLEFTLDASLTLEQLKALRAVKMLQVLPPMPNVTSEPVESVKEPVKIAEVVNE